jgi:hypothetical protein
MLLRMTREEAQALLSRYTTRTTAVENGPGYWNSLDVDVLLDGERIGGYRRNYHSLFDTFVPFIQDDGQGGVHILALYSPHYTATRLMKLPECVDIGGEDPSSGGFCPTGFLVPYDSERGLTGRFGFVSGCVWGDDSSWKVEYLDLSEAAKGVLRRDDRFGYLELPRGMSLRDAVHLEHYRDDAYGRIEFTVARAYYLKQGKFPDPYE